MRWKSSRLSEISYIGDGAHASLKRESRGIPYLTAKNITKSGIDHSKVEYISQETYNKHFKQNSNALTQPKQGDILYSIIGSIGGVYVVQDEKIGISSSVAIFRAKTEVIDYQYLAYFLKSPCFGSQVKAIKGGVAQGFMSLGKMGSVQVLYPDDIEYQKRIVGILSTYDDLIENNKKQIKLLEETAEHLYREWFVELHFPECEDVKIVDGVPKGWLDGTVGDIALFKRGKTITKAQIHKGNVPVVAGGLEPAYYHNVANTVAPVITISGSGANAGFARLYNVDVFASDCSFVDSQTTPYLYWVYCFIKDSKAKLDSLQKGATQPHVYAKDINALKIYIPTDDILDRFCKVVTTYFDKIKNLQRQNDLLLQARDRLLPRLMSGEVEV